jgi:cytochrome c peroxidase
MVQKLFDISNRCSYISNMKQFILIFLLSFNTLANDAVEALGEKIFNDVRFSKHFYQASAGNPNTPIDQIDQPEKLVSCSSCHSIDQNFDELGMRGYNDFEVRTPLAIPVGDMTHSLRNTPGLIGIGSRFSRNNLSHHDGELVHSQTYLGNFLGPHNGWQANEKNVARNNIVKVLREDRGNLAEEEFSYRTILLGVDPALPEDLRLPEEWRVDIDNLTDAELVDTMVRAGTAYLEGIDFETDEEGHYIGSPYDQFLKANNIDRGPKEGEDNFQYSARLIQLLRKLEKPKFIEKKFFPTQKREFEFGEKEYRGLKVFFNLEATQVSGRGMCIQCHTAPLFTDQSFHNIAVTQKAYDKEHGEGAYLSLKVPGLKERNEDAIFFLEGKDLGVWNWFAREDKEILTKFIRSEFCAPGSECSDEYLLPFMAGRFKTPTLRNLGMSNPYFHDGSASTIKETLTHYQNFARKVRQRTIANPAPQMRMMRISDQDIEDLNAFLESLNEDYD